MCSEGASGEVSSEILRGVDYWHVVAASVRGTSHQKRQQPCQDAHYWGTVHDDVLVAAVADGASSAALGKVGATLAVCAAATTVCARHQRTVCPENDAAWRQWLVDAMRAAQATVVAEAQARQVTVRELATTLILVVAMPARVAVAQIGDGAVVVSDMAGNLFPLMVPQHGEYPNETTFLISPNALATAASDRDATSCGTLLLTTDTRALSPHTCALALHAALALPRACPTITPSICAHGGFLGHCFRSALEYDRLCAPAAPPSTRDSAPHPMGDCAEDRRECRMGSGMG